MLPEKKIKVVFSPNQDAGGFSLGLRRTFKVTELQLYIFREAYAKIVN